MSRATALAGYLQDQWTNDRLTISGGVRVDYLNAWVPAVSLPAGTYVPARNFGEVGCVPCWTDVTPRVSASYDVFGTGKTAIKVTFGRFLGAELLNLADSNNPLNASNATATRAWDDRNRDFVPQDAELGPLSNAAFGTVTITTQYADDVLREKRPYAWQGSAIVQHEVRPGVAATFGYFRTSWGNFRAIDNLDVTPADYDPYSLRLPVDERLPGGGGNLVTGLYDIKPEKYGMTNHLLVTQSSHYGDQKEIFSGIDLTINARLARSAFVQGGISTGRTETDRCFVVDNPQSLLFCNVKSPFWRPQLKLSGSYTLPLNINASAVVQSLPGIPISASYVATNAEVRPSLQRPLAGDLPNVTISDAGGALGTAPAPGFVFTQPGVIPPQTMFADRSNQVDARLTRVFRFGARRLNLMFDIYNLLNSTPVLGINSRYGPAWQNPTFVLDARIFKFGAQFDF
jgi:hypothetical protein